jgi:hypothetical protein
VSFYVSTATFFLLHCDEWDRVVALPRHKFVTGATLLQLEETGVPRENHRPLASHYQILSHNVISSTPRHERGLNSQLLVLIGTDSTGSCKSNYHTITTTTVPIVHECSTTGKIPRVSLQCTAYKQLRHLIIFEKPVRVCLYRNHDNPIIVDMNHNELYSVLFVLVSIISTTSCISLRFSGKSSKFLLLSR